MIYTHSDIDSIKTEIEITTYCNARCKRCPRTNPETGAAIDWLVQEHMSLDTFKMIFNNQNAASNKLRHVKLCGQYGDPMMHPHINEIIEYTLEDKNVSMLINTNGGLRNASWYKSIAEKYGRRIYIIFGIDGLDHETNWKYREGVMFDKAYANMVSYQQSGGETSWQFIVFSWNVHQIEDVYKQATELGVELTYIVDLEYAEELRIQSDYKIEELKQRFSNLGVDNYQGI